jgi:1-acyl-sn-glycerol-3-phosphate acyltransferase
MDHLDCRLSRASQAPGWAIARLAQLSERPDAETGRWNTALRLCLRLYAAACVRQRSIRFQAPLPPGPKIIAFNHANVTDACLLPFIFPGDLCFLAQANLFELPVFGGLLTRAGQLPVVRGQGVALIEAAARRLRQGCSIVVCPEGRLNHGGPLHRAGVGTVRLALQSGFPIVPVGFFVADRHAKIIRAKVDGRETYGRWQVGGTCQVEIGRPWRLEAMSQPLPGYRQQRCLTDELMRQISTLVQQAETRAAL